MPSTVIMAKPGRILAKFGKLFFFFFLICDKVVSSFNEGLIDKSSGGINSFSEGLTVREELVGREHGNRILMVTFPSYGWLSPRIFFSREEDPSKLAEPKPYLSGG
jgi:hypothetical protein